MRTIPTLTIKRRTGGIDTFLDQLQERTSGIRYWTTDFTSDGSVDKITLAFARWYDLRSFVCHPPIVNLIEENE